MSTTTNAGVESASDEQKKNLLHRIATKKAVVKLLPLMMLAYLISYIDRTNVGLAKEALQVDVGISAAAFGLGAGIFFISYALLEIPSNILMHRIGARVWLARIAIMWGVLSSAMMFVNSETAFYVLRFLLGAAEAGLFPGIMYVITVWFAQSDRARIVSMILISGALGAVVGNPIGGALMLLDGIAGLSGWQWMFLIEGIPAVIVGLVFLAKFPNRPHDAKWLTKAEADVLVEKAGDPDAQAHVPMRHAFSNKVILAASALYFLSAFAVWGSVFFIPSVIGSMGVSNQLVIGLLAGAVSLGSMLGLIIMPRLARSFGELRMVAVSWVGVVASALGFVALAGNGPAQITVLCSIAFFVMGMQPMIWSLAMARVSGKIAAAGLAMVNTIGLLAGFIGPVLFGLAQSATGSAAAGFALLIPAGIIGLAVVALTARIIRKETVQASAVAQRELVNA